MRPRRRFNFMNVLVVTTTFIVGFFTLVGLSTQEENSLTHFTDTMLQIVAITLALAILLGILNLLAVHLGRIRDQQAGWPYSLLTLLTAILVAGIHLLDRAEFWQGDLEGEKLSPTLFRTLQLNIEAALAGLVAFFLVYSAWRFMSRRTGWAGLLFVAALVISLLGALHLKDNDSLASAREWLLEVPVLAGSRGLLIGVGLGSVIVGLRVLVGLDDSYREP